jgi:hypothetical protein
MQPTMAADHQYDSKGEGSEEEQNTDNDACDATTAESFGSVGCWSSYRIRRA